MSEISVPAVGQNINFYKVLDVSKEASSIQIREAYIRMKNTFSNTNDATYSLFSGSECQRQLEMVELAFETLKNETTRRNYNQRYFGKQQDSSFVKKKKDQLPPTN